VGFGTVVGGPPNGVSWGGYRRRDILSITPILLVGPYLCWSALRSLDEANLAPFAFLLVFGLAGAYSGRHSEARLKVSVVTGVVLAALSTLMFLLVRLAIAPVVWTLAGCLMITAGETVAFIGGSNISAGPKADGGAGRSARPAGPPPAPGRRLGQGRLAGKILAGAANTITTTITAAAVSALLLHFGLKS
jgi:hypothetical protein